MVEKTFCPHCSPYEGLSDAYVKEKARPLKNGEKRKIYKCRGCERTFAERKFVKGTGSKDEVNYMDPKVYFFLERLIMGEDKIEGLKKGQKITSSLIRNYMKNYLHNKEDFNPRHIPSGASIQRMINRFNSGKTFSAHP